MYICMYICRRKWRSVELDLNVDSCACFCQLGVRFVGVLVIRALLFGVYIKAPAFWKLPWYMYIYIYARIYMYAGFFV